VEWGSNLSLYI